MPYIYFIQGPTRLKYISFIQFSFLEWPIEKSLETFAWHVTWEEKTFKFAFFTIFIIFFVCRHVKIYDVKDYKVVHSMDYPSPILCLGLSVSSSLIKIKLVYLSLFLVFNQHWGLEDAPRDTKRYFGKIDQFPRPYHANWYLFMQIAVYTYI